jgi:S1-C subfamily serine protease
MKALRPFFMIVSLVLAVGLACAAIGGGGSSTQPAPAPTQPASEKATQSSDTPSANTSNGNAINTLGDAQNAVVQIESQGTFIDPQVGLVVNGAGRGSGFIIDPSGIAVTNNHVVTGSALLKVWVGGVQHNAQILGVSECSDLAVIKIDGGPYPFLNWYDGQAKTGLEVYAAGFPLGEPQFSLTKGIISKEKADGQTSWASLDYVLGHDATINPGNSGGPLITGDGQVVGINYSSLKSANQYFAIDEKTARPVVDKLIQGNDVDSIGINGTAVLSDNKAFSGIWVSSVKSGSPADKSGVKPGDILYQMESLVLATDGTMKDYCNILRTHKPEDTLSLSVIRFDSGELLEGQLNGRELVVTKNFDVSGGNTNTDTNTSGGNQGSDFFTEEFNQDPGSAWTFEVLGPNSTDNASKATYSFDSGLMIFDIEAKDLYAYYFYEGQTYDNVRVDMRFENRGVNSQNVSLVCRASKEGWYEFSVASSGVWVLWAYTPNDGFVRLKNGGSTAIRQGKAVNEYGMACNDDKISLFINGQEVRDSPFTEKQYALRRGNVGFNISSLKVFPVKAEVDWFQISQP